MRFASFLDKLPRQYAFGSRLKFLLCNLRFIAQMTDCVRLPKHNIPDFLQPSFVFNTRNTRRECGGNPTTRTAANFTTIFTTQESGELNRAFNTFRLSLQR